MIDQSFHSALTIKSQVSSPLIRIPGSPLQSSDRFDAINRHRSGSEAHGLLSVLYGIGAKATTAHFAEQIPKAELHPRTAGGAATAATAPKTAPAAV
jgi:hypothetical protein